MPAHARDGTCDLWACAAVRWGRHRWIQCAHEPSPGLRIVPHNDLAALKAAVDETTAAVLIEPIQGEAGVVIPDDCHLTGVRELTRLAGCLFTADEIQSVLGRTGRTPAAGHEAVVPDMAEGARGQKEPARPGPEPGTALPFTVIGSGQAS